jgi:hypothetical protein
MPGLVQSTRIPVLLVPVEVIAEAALAGGVPLDPLLLIDLSRLHEFLHSVSGRHVLKAAAALWTTQALAWHKAALVMQPQSANNLCWAAVAASTARYYDAGTIWTQCALAEAEFNQRTCCQNVFSASCNKAHYLGLALTRAQVLQPPVRGQVYSNRLQDEIDAYQPVGWRIEWNGGGAHFAAIYCWMDDSGTLWLGIADPDGPELSTISMDELTHGVYGDGGTWTNTYLTQP